MINSIIIILIINETKRVPIVSVFLLLLLYQLPHRSDACDMFSLSIIHSKIKGIIYLFFHDIQCIKYL